MPLARAVSLRKIVTGVDNRHADYRYTQRIHLHINLRTRLLYIAPQSPVPGNVVTELSGGHRHFAAQPARAGQACGRSVSVRRGARWARGRVRATRRQTRRLRWRTDERSHGPAPTHDSLRRNDEAAGYARALCVAASESLRLATRSDDAGVNKPATHLLLTQWRG